MNEKGLSNLKDVIEKNKSQNNIFIWGATKKSDFILEKMEQWGYKVKGFIDRDYENIKEYKEYKVYGTEALEENCFVYVALTSSRSDVIEKLEQFGYQEFVSYWYPGKLVQLDGTENYQDLYGNQLVTYNKTPINVRLRNGGKIFIRSMKLNSTTKVTSEGDSSVSIASNVSTGEGVIVSSTNGVIDIGEQCKLDSHIVIRASSGGKVYIHEKTTIERQGTLVASFNAKIDIGVDCMLSYFVMLRAGNSHNMIDLETGKHLDDNDSRDVILGQHVWIGMRVTLLNGVKVGPGSTVGANTFICKREYGNNCCIAGNPSRVLRQRTAWMRDGVTMRKNLDEYKGYIFDN